MVCIAAANGDRNEPGASAGPGGYPNAERMSGDRQQQASVGGVYVGRGYDGSGGPVGTMIGGTTPGNEPTDITSGWRHNEAVQDQAARAFDQNIRDRSTVRSTENGEIYSGVSNPVADSAVDSGAATQFPTNELPTTTTEPGQ